MKSPKFSLNAFIAVVMLFSVIGFFFTVKMVNLADRYPVNEYTVIEGTNLAVRYSNLEENGICEGSAEKAVLKLPGNYGADWGAFVSGNSLFINEYTSTKFGMMLCNVVKIDLQTYEKETVLEDAILRGRCASGEPVCVSGCMLPSDFPETNSLCKLYGMTAAEHDVTVLYLDPETAEVVASVHDDAAMKVNFEKCYLNRTLEEVAE